MSSYSINFGPYNTNEDCSNFVQIVPAHTSHSSHFTYHTQRQDVDVEYLGRVRMALHSQSVASTLWIQPALDNYTKLMNEVRNKATDISNRYKIQIETIQFKWDKFLPTLEKDFPDILNEVLCCKNNQTMPPNFQSKHYSHNGQAYRITMHAT